MLETMAGPGKKQFPPSGTRFLAPVLICVLAALVPASALAFDPEEARDLARDPHRILLAAAIFDTREGPPPLPAELTAMRAAGADYLIIQFRGAIGPREQALVETAGGEILDYIPNHALLVRLTPAAEEAIRSHLDLVQWVGLYEPAYRLSPEIGKRTFSDPARAADDHLWLTLDVFRGEGGATVAAAVRALGAAVLGMDEGPLVRRLRARARPELLDDLARLRAVQWIEEWGEFTLRNNTTRWVIQSNINGVTPLWNHGIHGENQIVGHIDERISLASCYFLDPADNTPGPNHRKIVAYRSSSGPGAGGHGTHTAGTIAGDREPVNGSTSGNGIAYRARISHTNLDDVTGNLNTASNLAQYLTLAHQDGARVHTNSWGDDVSSGYTTWCRDIDVFSRNFEESLVGFASSNLPALRTPENAKNVLAIGASEQAPNQGDIGSGGTGPTHDGRRKPELFAPGIGIISASTAACGTGGSSGTSMASPAVMGAAALVRQYYEEGWYPSGTALAGHAFEATGALVKATLLNAGVDMASPGYPSYQEGWGRLLLDNAVYFDGDQRNLQVHDVRHANGLATSEIAAFDFEVESSIEPLRVTMVFTDQPAALGAALTPVNDLDLVMFVPLSKAAVEEGSGPGAGDPLNNVEMFLLDNPTPGPYFVHVTANQVVGERQGFALVVTGDLVPPSGGIGGPAASLAPGLRIVSVVPNPFRGETEIAVASPWHHPATVGVYDASGRLVRVLRGGIAEAGLLKMRWDGRDGSGSPLAAGVYLLKMDQQSAFAPGARKAVLLR